MDMGQLGGITITKILPILIGLIIGFRVFFPKKERVFWNKLLNKKKWSGIED